jgi:HK97 family phage prohead protease
VIAIWRLGEKMDEKEIRVLDLGTSKLQVEKREDGNPKISGYAAVFNSDSEDMGFIERIKPGAFKSAIKKSDVRALFNHDQNLIFGRSGVNLSLKEDKKGLFMEVAPLQTKTYQMVEENIRSGLVTQQSFAFTVKSDEWNDDFTQRTIREVGEIFDVSPVTYPAYSDTTVALRSMKTAKATTDDDSTKAGDTPTSHESAKANPGDDSRDNNSGDTPTSHEPQTAEEIDARFLSKLNKRKGF